MMDSFSYCQEEVSNKDKDRYVSGLFAKYQKNHLFSLYAFDIEMSRMREKVKEPLPGELRLQWWRDTINGTGMGTANDHPIIYALLATIERYHLPLESFDRYLEARIFDLYDDPMENLNQLYEYFANTAGIMFELSCEILSDNQVFNAKASCEHAGIAYGLTKVLRALPWHSRRQQLYLPIEILKQHNVDQNDIFGQNCTPEILNMLEEMRNMIRNRMNKFKFSLKFLPKVVVPGFLPLYFIEDYLKNMEREDYRPFESNIEINPLRRMFVSTKAFSKAMKTARK